MVLATSEGPDKVRHGLTSEEDLGRTSTFAELLLLIMTGKSDPTRHLTEPVDVAVSDERQPAYVSDFGQGLVYRFDLE